MIWSYSHCDFLDCTPWIVYIHTVNILYSHREYFIFTPWIVYIHTVNMSYSRCEFFRFWETLSIIIIIIILVVIFSSFIFETRKIGFSQFRIFENDSNHTDFQWFYLKTNWLYLGFLRFSWKILKTKIWKTTRVSPCFSIIFCCIFVIFQSPNCILCIS